MLYYIGVLYSDTPLRLFSSFLVLLSIGCMLAAILAWFALPRLWHRLPHDHGKALAPGGMVSKGKPTGAGIIVALCILPALILVVPLGQFKLGFATWGRAWIVVAALYFIMLFGYLDDRSAKPWGQLKKAVADIGCCLACALAMHYEGMNSIWLPFTKQTFELGIWLYVPAATFILFVAVNSLNCSDGVDGLAGSLGIMTLLALSVLLYLVLGYRPVAEYLLLPHYPGSAQWAVILVSVVGGFASYLWYNAEPSQVLMGDAGSRMLGLAIGVAVLATGNPLLIFVFAPVIFANGGTGLVKIILLRIFKKFGCDITPSSKLAPEAAARQNAIVRELHSIRFPLHDHCRKNLGWSNAQVLMRFMLLQAFMIPLLFAVFTKVR